MFGRKDTPIGVNQKKKKYNNLIDRYKTQHSKSSYKHELTNWQKERDTINKKGMKKWIKDNDYDYDEYGISEYKSALKEAENRVKDAKKYINKVDVLYKKLDDIDTSDLTYKEAKQKARQTLSDWLD